MKDEADVINLAGYKSIVTHWIDLHVNGNSVTYCDCFNVEHISKEITKFFDNNHLK